MSISLLSRSLPKDCLLWPAFVAIVISVFSSSFAFAGGGPENLILVVNADSASSKMIANHYIHGRNIPSRNVIYLTGIPPKETTNETIFRDKIINPILREIEIRKLAGTVDYIVYSSDFPTMITINKHFIKLRDKLKKKRARLFQ